MLSTESRQLLEALIQEHLKQHNNDARKCLSAMGSLESIRQQLLELGDDQLQAALGRGFQWVQPVRRSSDAESSATQTINFGGGPTPSASAALPTGPRFRILRPHAKGGLGEVFVAVDGELNRHVALKHIQDRHADDDAVRNRFLLEAEITGGLEHPSIVPVYGLGVYPDGRPYSAMRFIRGDSLLQATETISCRGIVARNVDPGIKDARAAETAEPVDQRLRCHRICP